MCTVLLSPGDNPIAVNKYIISYNSNQPVLEMKHKWSQTIDELGLGFLSMTVLNV